jgi:hypothetical protein
MAEGTTEGTGTDPGASTDEPSTAASNNGSGPAGAARPDVSVAPPVASGAPDLRKLVPVIAAVIVAVLVFTFIRRRRRG